MYCPHNRTDFCPECVEHTEQEEINKIVQTTMNRHLMDGDWD